MTSKLCVDGVQVVEDELIKNHMQSIVEVSGNVFVLHCKCLDLCD